MNLKLKSGLLIFFIPVLFLTFSSCFTEESQNYTGKRNRINIEFSESDSVFANPGQGWMSSRLPGSIKYIRIGWAELEPEKGKYNWGPFERAIEEGREKGRKISIRIMTCNAHSKTYYTSPKWLFDYGCKGIEYLRGGDDPTFGGIRTLRIEPVYSDPLFLYHHEEFIKALADKYNGSPDLEFLDIGSYGIWGEWHTPNPAPVEVRKKIVDMYVNAFTKTPLVFMTDDAEVLPYALSKGTGLRRDGVGSRWHENTWIGSEKYAGVEDMAEAWKQAPVVFEWYGNYDYLLSRNWSFDSAVNFMLNNHVTIINDNIGKVPDDQMPKIYKLARLAGARLVLNEISYPVKVKRGNDFKIQMKFSNKGVGKLYHPYVIRCFLLDTGEDIEYYFDLQADLMKWLPGDYEINESVNLPISVKKGKYSLAVGIVDKEGKRNPFKLAINLPEQNGLYILNDIKIN